MYAEDARQVPQICRFRFCQPCGQILPPRCEHCNKASCDTCILKIDHHCKFMGNNCIGFLNHKFFILYLLYLQLGLQLTCIPFWHQILWHKRGFFELLDESIARTLAGAIAFAISSFLMVLFIVQMHMLRMNMTMYELTLSRRLKPFRHKLWVKNW
jgi:predicted nucleic acid binding AN1-type Zn finger protein